MPSDERESGTRLHPHITAAIVAAVASIIVAVVASLTSIYLAVAPTVRGVIKESGADIDELGEDAALVGKQLETIKGENEKLRAELLVIRGQMTDLSDTIKASEGDIDSLQEKTENVSATADKLSKVTIAAGKITVDLKDLKSFRIVHGDVTEDGKSDAIGFTMAKDNEDDGTYHITFKRAFRHAPFVAVTFGHVGSDTSPEEHTVRVDAAPTGCTVYVRDLALSGNDVTSKSQGAAFSLVAIGLNPDDE
jgi:hypothetical protein